MDAQTDSDPAETNDQTRFFKNLTNDELSMMSNRQKGFIISIRALDPSIAGTNLKEAIAEMFPPSHLFSDEIKEIPSVWMELRKHLDLHGATLQQHSSRRIILTLAHSLYEDAEDREAAVSIANSIVAEGRRPRNQSQTDDTLPPGRPPDTGDSDSRPLPTERVAHNVAMRLKDNEKKFSGDIGDCWMEFVDEYDQISLDYNLTQPQKLQYMHNILHKDAHRFYVDRVKAYATTFDQAVRMIDSEYNSPVRQNRVKNVLTSLRVTNFMNENVDTAMALAKVYKLILKLSRQVPFSHRGDAHRIEFLRGAVIGFNWSREPLSRIATNDLTFQQLYGELESAVQLDKESRIATIRDRAGASTKDEPEDAVAINYAGQGRYGHPRQSAPGKTNFKATRTDPLSIMGCFNCDSPEHMARNCTQPKNFSKAAARKLEYHQKKKTPNSVHVVLAHLCQQLDHEIHDDDDHSDPINDAQIFMNVVAGATDTGAMPSTQDEEDDPIDIFSVNTVFQATVHHEFLGACIDSGAQRTVIGHKQAEAYTALTGIRKADKARGNMPKYKFGDTTHDGLGKMKVRIPIKEDYFVDIEASVVDVDVPLLIGLDVLGRLKVILDFNEFTMSSTTENWTIPLSRKMGHAYIEWADSILYTELELRRMHKHFYHPSTEKLYAVIKRAEPSTTHTGIYDILDKVRNTCETCQRNSREPHRFRVSLPGEECTFNRIVSMDIMSLDSKPVLHVVDRDTKLGAACFLDGESAAHVWRAFLNIWVSVYVGYPDYVAIDQGPQFQSHEFKSFLNSAGIQLRPSGIESHNALGNGERYHSYLRSVYHKVRDDATQLSKADALRLAIKAVNDTAGPAGLVPTLLVFGVMPRLPIHPKDLPEQRDRMQAMQSARTEMTKIVAKTRVHVALSKNVPAAADAAIRILDKVLVYREKPVNKWLGPYNVLDINGKIVHVDINGKSSQFSVDKVKPFQEAGETDDVAPNGEHEYDDHGTPSPTDADGNDLELDEWGRHIDRYWNMDRELTGDEVNVFTIKIVKPNDERAMRKDFQDAKRDEVQGLSKRQIWTPISEASIPKNANILGGRFILSLKNCDTPDEKAKVRYVAQGFKDHDKPYMVHDVSTLRVSSIRTVLSVAVIKGFRIFSHDVTQAYLQSKTNLTRKVYIRPKQEDRKVLGIKNGEVFRLVRPLYGLCDAGDYWTHTMETHLVNDLKMQQASGDSALFFWKKMVSYAVSLACTLTI